MGGSSTTVDFEAPAHFDNVLCGYQKNSFSFLFVIFFPGLKLKFCELVL